MNFNKDNIPSRPSPLGTSSNTGRQARPHPLRALFSLYPIMNPTLCSHGNRKPSVAAALQFDPKGSKVPKVLFHRNNGRATHFNGEARFRSCELVLNIHEREYAANMRKKILGLSGRRRQPQQIQPAIVPTSLWIHPPHPPQPAQPAPQPAPPAPQAAPQPPTGGSGTGVRRPNSLRRRNAGYGVSINGEVRWGLERAPSPPAFSPPPSPKSTLSSGLDRPLNAGDPQSAPSTSEVDQESDTTPRASSPPRRPLRREGAQFWGEDPIPEPTPQPLREDAVVQSDHATPSTSGSTSATTSTGSSPQASGSLEPRTPSASTLRTYVDEESGLEYVEYVDDPLFIAPQIPVAESSALAVAGTSAASPTTTTAGGSDGNPADNATSDGASASSPSHHRGQKRSRDSDAESQDEEETARRRRRPCSVEPTAEMEVDVSAAAPAAPRLLRRSTRTQVLSKMQGIYKDVKARFKM